MRSPWLLSILGASTLVFPGAVAEHTKDFQLPSIFGDDCVNCEGDTSHFSNCCPPRVGRTFTADAADISTPTGSPNTPVTTSPTRATDVSLSEPTVPVDAGVSVSTTVSSQPSATRNPNQGGSPFNVGAATSGPTGLSTTAKIAIGVGVGAGVPIILGLIAILFLCGRKRRNRVLAPYDTLGHEGEKEGLQGAYIDDQHAMHPLQCTTQTPPFVPPKEGPNPGRQSVIMPETLPPVPSNTTENPAGVGTFRDQPNLAPLATTTISPRPLSISTAATLSPTAAPAGSSSQPHTVPPVPPIPHGPPSPVSPVSPVSPLESRSSSFRRPGR